MAKGHWISDEPPHRCHTPPEDELRLHRDELWVCDECGRKWRVAFMDGGMREPDVHYYYMKRADT